MPALCRNLDLVSGMTMKGPLAYLDLVLPNDSRFQSYLTGSRVDQLQVPWVARELKLPIVVERPLVPPHPGDAPAGGVIEVHREQQLTTPLTPFQGNLLLSLYIEDAAGVTDESGTDYQIHATSLPGRGHSGNLQGTRSLFSRWVRSHTLESRQCRVHQLLCTHDPSSVG
jgi:hypothetical protein